VPVDFSASSEAALLFALDFAQSAGQSVLVLHVVHDPGSMPGYYSRALKQKHLVRIEDGATDMLQEFLAEVGDAHEQLFKANQVESMLVKGVPTSRILEVAKKVSASMIVIGSQGLTGWKHLMVGSVSEQVVRLASVPVTVVKSDKKKAG